MSLPVHFSTTRWSVVHDATGSSIGPQAALEELCAACRKPLYGFARMNGYSIEGSQDLLQGIVEKLLTSGKIGNPQKNKGTFRSYLLATCKNFATDQRRKEGKLTSRELRDAIALEPEFNQCIVDELSDPSSSADDLESDLSYLLSLLVK